jgi:hypothetical protein
MKRIIGMAVVLVLLSYTIAPSQIFKTSLTLTVRDEIGNVVEGASVKLFENQENYNKEVNAVAETTTDAKGIAKFKGIRPISYYVLVKKGDKDNAGGGEKIDKLDEGKFNKSTIVIQ